MAVKQFKAESKKLLDLMINSIYSNKEIFLRELISNASDAIDKLYFKSLTDHSVTTKKEDYKIFLALDKDSRTITLTDNGIGMTKEELEKNLGTIARSGSFDFKAENKAEDIDIIGQFGVGFYSAFMVASRVTVISRAFSSEEAWKWESKGAEGYTITETEKAEPGTQIILVVKESTEKENYDEFLDEYNLVRIVKKYSDYVRYPIEMYREKSRQKEKPADAGEDYEPEYESYTELETLNSMVPLWKRAKKDVADEEYNQFYKDKFYDYTDPARVIVSRTEGTATYNALLFVPGRAPYNYYTREYEKGLQLYASGVLIMEKCADLLPDYFSFVKGVVDSQDLSLNISREMLQQDGQLKLIRGSLEKKIKNELNAMKNNEREKYDEFFKNFGRQLKFGCYADYGMNTELLKDLLLFYSAKEKKLITLAEYVEKMPEEQKYIYYAAGESADRLAKLPAAELVLEKGFDLLLLTEDVDEFCLQVLRHYGEKDKEKEFKNISGGELGLETEEEKKAAQEAGEASKPLFDAMKEALGDKVTDVRISTRLKSHPVCISSEGPLSLEMEKVLGSMPGAEGEMAPKSQKVLELNGEHPVFAKLKALQEAGDKETLGRYADILYNQALLIEGLPIEDPVAYAQAVCELMK
ncbi:molecular chaperone HtpG [Allofournierella sp.]|uniref:molecular chaperone HtpG n=1 Tax=Allofournierella sp. TaxID=1940256 RepID=UPI003AB63B0E